MGILVGISESTFGSQTSNQSAITREILIHDGYGNLTRVTLWGDAARQIKEKYLDDTDRYIVLIITSTLVEKFNSKP